MTPQQADGRRLKFRLERWARHPRGVLAIRVGWSLQEIDFAAAREYLLIYPPGHSSVVESRPLLIRSFSRQRIARRALSDPGIESVRRRGCSLACQWLQLG